MWASFVESDHEKTDTIRSAPVLLSVNLCLLINPSVSSARVEWIGLVLSAMEETRRLAGMGRLKTIRSAIACCRMKLLKEILDVQKKDRRNVPQHASVRCQPCNRNTDVIIYAIHLLLVRSQLSSRSLWTIRTWESKTAVLAHLESQEDCMSLGTEAHSC